MNRKTSTLLFTVLFVLDFSARANTGLFPADLAVDQLNQLCWAAYCDHDRAVVVERLLELADYSEKGFTARLELARELSAASPFGGCEDVLPEIAEAILTESLRWLGKLQIVEGESLLAHYREIEVRKDSEPEEESRLLKLKCLAGESYWQVKAMTYSSTEEQNAFLLRLVEEKVQSSITPGTIEWAAEELANRAVISALPVITASFERHSNFDLALSEQLWRIERKMELISTSKNRVAALKAALEEENEKDWYSLKYWAVEELAKLNTEESCEILLDYLRSAQCRCFNAADESGRIADFRKDLSDEERRECMELGGHYTHIVSIMEFIGFDDQRLNEAGVFPGVYFFAL